MSEAKRLINRAIDLIVQGESRGAEAVLELALDEVDKLLQTVKSMQWQPISDAPLDGTEVDIWSIEFPYENKGHRICDAYFGHHSYMNGKPSTEKSWGDPSMDGPGPKPTHFMFKPAPPTGNQIDNLRAAGLAEGE